MIVMSDDFKKAVSSTEREMKGYVEVTYSNTDAKDNATIIGTPSELQIGGSSLGTSYILDDDRKGKNYASLEENYFILDGTMVLLNNDATKNDGIGFISASVFEDDNTIPTTPFDITINSNEKTNALTIYFQNNQPISLKAEITASEGDFTYDTNYDNDITINDLGTATIIFNQELTLEEVKIYVRDVMYPERRIRLQEIDFGLSQIYEGEDLISFKTIEQCNRFGFELPINECTVEIGDYDNKFDENNPNNIINYLNKNVMVRPFVGVKTEDSGIEYCTMGTYWFDEIKSDKQKAKINCKGFLNKLQQQVYPTSSTMTSLQQYLQRINIDIDFTYEESNGINTIGTRNYQLKLGTGIDAMLKYQVYYSSPFIEVKRNSNIRHEILGLTPEEKYFIAQTISLNRLKETAIITKNELIKFISIKEYQYRKISETAKTLYETTVICDGEETLVYDYGKPTGTMTYIIADDYTGLEILDARNHIYDKNDNLLYEPDYGGVLLEYSYAKIRYNGTIKFRVVQSGEYNEEISENVINYNEEGKEISIDNEFISGNDTRKLSNYLASFIYNNYSRNSVNFNYNGNPELELGDCIKVENKYSTEESPLYDKVWVTKIESEFKGSFNQTIEGDILEN